MKKLFVSLLMITSVSVMAKSQTIRLLFDGQNSRNECFGLAFAVDSQNKVILSKSIINRPSNTVSIILENDILADAEKVFIQGRCVNDVRVRVEINDLEAGHLIESDLRQGLKIDAVINLKTSPIEIDNN
jgi:hypothetical protein